ncbi:ABC transporter substrate-binding protein, partial [Acidisphaera sp. L21]|uniref:ABC transporter substrate-binding protein n=1 Tax=Acidisphaera sp. L21 TaxID=1641851 RepID=UPI00131BF65F
MIGRRPFMAGLASVSASLSRPALAASGDSRTLRVIPQANLTSLDPVWTSAVVTRNHGYMVYDQLLAVDAGFTPRPQMVAGWTVEDDGLTWRFTLRPGLRFHDDEPVRAQDCVASIQRWWARDTLGQMLKTATNEVMAVDDTQFVFRLRNAFPLLPFALGKSSPNPLFVMPERIAKTDPYEQVKDPVGSGPFRFVADEWNPGSRAVWTRFGQYQPRNQPVDGLAGGKRANVERVEWTVIADSATSANAMIAGEQDYWEYPLHDLLGMLQSAPDIVVGQRLSEGTYAEARLNHLQPPFDNPATRRALLMAVDQAEYMEAVVGDDPSRWGRCESIYNDKGPFYSEAGNALLRTHSVEKAQAALAQSG